MYGAGHINLDKIYYYPSINNYTISSIAIHDYFKFKLISKVRKRYCLKTSEALENL